MSASQTEAQTEAQPPSQPQAPVAAAPETPLSKFNARLPAILEKTGHGEMWGVPLSNTDHVPTAVVLQKFLRANNGDLSLAEKQLVCALEWRKQMRPTELVNQTFDEKKFKDLGFVTVHKTAAGEETVITWNVYGAVKNNKATFGDIKEFIKWRVAIMELGAQKLRIDEATTAIPEDGNDPYQMIQVHDYLNVSFLRMDPLIRAATKETISVLSNNYPELLAHKYFVNVPAIMGWMFAAMKLFLAAATLKKFHPMTSGATLAAEMPTIVSSLPKEYGGQGPSVKDALTIRLAPASEISDEALKVVEETKPAESAPTLVAPEKIPEETEPAELTLSIREDKPVEQTKLAEEAPPIEQAKPVEVGKPAEDPKFVEVTKAGEPKVAEHNTAGESKAVGEAKHAEEVKTAIKSATEPKAQKEEQAKSEVVTTEAKAADVKTEPATDGPVKEPATVIESVVIENTATA